MGRPVFSGILATFYDIYTFPIKPNDPREFVFKALAKVVKEDPSAT